MRFALSLALSGRRAVYSAFLSSSAGTSTTGGLRREEVLGPRRCRDSIGLLVLVCECRKSWERLSRSARGRDPQDSAKVRR
ncbi:uncharacterized protein BJ212DRAFT_1389222 [Suillus subaureus]|uniref:Uncharacterized protein n=1 Tax=Suillus subaureus TaxID=48587 RepID=A0A9P7DXT8_9AGAM|nr:uncharacterized protein BJ212DRAFT_1389222 [Suillus subaureus]KAG1806062.1 hypothetical protein BJ212DRAFT_1389222 [Suillus subaureus]